MATVPSNRIVPDTCCQDGTAIPERRKRALATPFEWRWHVNLSLIVTVMVTSLRQDIGNRDGEAANALRGVRDRKRGKAISPGRANLGGENARIETVDIFEPHLLVQLNGALHQRTIDEVKNIQGPAMASFAGAER